MNKWKKIIFFIMILTICTAGLFIKNKLSQQEEIFVLSEENSKDDLEIEKDANIEINESTNEVSSKEVTVYISGEVNSPGIVTVNSGERLANVVEKVGGVTSNADLNQVNMAIKVEDEEHYIIPKIGEVLEVQENTMAENSETKENSSKININKATIEELDSLPGVGEATANKIVNYRDENGEFKSIEEIKNVNGIGDKKFQDMKDLIIAN